MNPIKKAPVTALSTAEAVVAFVLTFLATHHIIGTIDVSATTQTVAPFVALALPAIFGAAKWALVTPYVKVRDLMERSGVLTDADFERLEQTVAQRMGVTLTDPETVAHPTDVPDSANAGAKLADYALPEAPAAP